LSGEPEYKLAMALLHEGLGVLAGYLMATHGGAILGVLLLALPFLLGRVLEMRLEPERIGGAKGWLAYGLGAYLAAWLLAWTYFYNYPT